MSKTINRLDKILECIENIEFILNNSNLKITNAIEDVSTKFKTIIQNIKKV